MTLWDLTHGDNAAEGSLLGKLISWHIVTSYSPDKGPGFICRAFLGGQKKQEPRNALVASMGDRGSLVPFIHPHNAWWGWDT